MFEIIFIVASLICCINGSYVISVYVDVFNDKDFFTRTYPWIIDNIGGEIMVDYYLLGSGRHTVPQMCALSLMRLNTFLQAQYLKCEAEGHSSEQCLCETGIDPFKFKDCVHNKGSLASYAAAKYSRLNIDASPLVEFSSRSTVFAVTDNWYLKKICTIFSNNLPRGCIKPFKCNSTEVWNAKRGVAQFNVNCDFKCDITTFEPTTSTHTTITADDYYWTNAT
ncbi:uncharacterized protein ACR2FA_009722 [Aphomia sociella]